MSGGDGIDSSPVVPGIKCRRFPRNRLQGHLPSTGQHLGVGAGGSGCVPSRGVRIRLIGLTSGKILPVRGF
jgi:hypothetical protein